ncbi:MAG: M20/M25/M40 family metallo-hydrolase [bacterium]|nr:M20/M25/M40 family metallo-hydrolase [bacterium]
MRCFVVVFVLGLSSAAAQEISKARIRSHVRFLASDLMEGRGPGTRGGALASSYIATQFALAGARPLGEDGTFFQTVPLVGVRTKPEAVLTFEVGSQPVAVSWLSEFAGTTHRQTPLEEFDAEVVFAGHGITAPEHGWNDFAEADVRGKVLLLFTGEPPSKTAGFFDGAALTYYGRWTYKFEQALEKGALGVLIVHTRETAGYGWDVVRNSWGREEAQARLAAGAEALAVGGWLHRDAASRVLALAGHTVDDLLKRARSRGFRPMPLGVRLRGRIPSEVREINTRNVAAFVPGSEIPEEAIAFTAHWDHLGIGPAVDGDSIYNGVIDNATGCAILLELARVWEAIERKPRRAAIFLAVTAEEAGLRGSRHYVEHPLWPLDKTVAALNFDAFHPVGRVKGVVLTGASKTPIWDQVRDAARRHNLEIKPEPNPGGGGFFRSDHFPFAQAKVPAFSIRVAPRLGQAESYYHHPSDEYREEWDFVGLEQVGRFAFLLGRMVADK